MRHTTNQAQHLYMKERQHENIEKSETNPAESWAWDRLSRIPGVCFRQHVWGCRIFDFYFPAKRIAVEIDGRQHEAAKSYDSHRDRYNFLRSGIIVIRVRAFNNQELDIAIQTIKDTLPWKVRKTSNTARKTAVVEGGLKLAHGRWTPPKATH